MKIDKCLQNNKNAYESVSPKHMNFERDLYYYPQNMQLYGRSIERCPWEYKIIIYHQ